MTEFGVLVERLWQDRDLSEYHFVHYEMVPYTLHFGRTAALCICVCGCTIHIEIRV